MARYYVVVLLAFCLLNFKAGAQGRVEHRLAGKRIKGIERENGANYFLVVGDWGRNGNGDQQAVADWMAIAADQLNARFVLSTGDNFYCCGVASTDDYQWISSFENVFRSHSLQIPWYLTLGNHDYQGNVQAQIDYSQKNQRWRMPARYFTKEMLGIQFVFIDTSPFIRNYYHLDSYPDLSQQDTTKQLLWLDSVLTASRERIKIVVGHHPLYSLGAHGNEPDMQRFFRSRFEKNAVRIYFAGHDHNLQSLQPVGSVTHFLISGAGAEKTPIKKNPDLARFAKETTGFIIVAVKGKDLKIHFVDSNGNLIYTENILK